MAPVYTLSGVLGGLCPVTVIFQVIYSIFIVCITTHSK